MRSVIDSLQWRYATKIFNSERKLSKEQLDILLDAIRLAPSSFGLQPWKVIVVSDTETRTKLRDAGYGQVQITDASHLLVFTVQEKLDDSYVDHFLAEVSKVRGVDIDMLQEYGSMMKGALAAKSFEQRIEWAARQAYIALGVLIVSAALEEIDVAPMEGFDPKKFDQILGLEEKGLRSVVIAGVGFRSEDDLFAQLQKVRFSSDEIFLTV